MILSFVTHLKLNKAKESCLSGQQRRDISRVFHFLTGSQGPTARTEKQACPWMKKVTGEKDDQLQPLRHQPGTSLEEEWKNEDKFEMECVREPEGCKKLELRWERPWEALQLEAVKSHHKEGYRNMRFQSFYTGS